MSEGSKVIGIVGSEHGQRIIMEDGAIFNYTYGQFEKCRPVPGSVAHVKEVAEERARFAEIASTSQP